MQAWGASSRYQQRKTEAFPTKSGLIGLIAASMGIDKEDPSEEAQIARLSELKLTVLPVARNKASQRTQRLRDYHTVGGGYDTNDPIEKLHITRKASGGPSGTVITERIYLTDARFIALFTGDTPLLQHCAEALSNPKWGVWFGRKACLPAAPLLPTLAASADQAIRALCVTADLTQDTVNRSHGQVEAPGDGAWFQWDHPISFAKRTHRSRPVKRNI